MSGAAHTEQRTKSSQAENGRRTAPGHPDRAQQRRQQQKSGAFTLVAPSAPAQHGAMNSHASRNFVLAVLGLLVVGALAWWLVSHLITLLAYILVIALVVGGAAFLVSKARRSIGGGRRRIGR